MLKKMNDNSSIKKGQKVMSKKGKILVGTLILIGVILVELSMYVVPFVEEIKTLEAPVFVVGVLLIAGALWALTTSMKSQSKER